MPNNISTNASRSIPFLLLSTFVDQWTEMVSKKRSGLKLEFILYGSGVLWVRVEGLLSKGNTVLPVNKN